MRPAMPPSQNDSDDNARAPALLPQDSDPPVDQLPSPALIDIIAMADEKKPQGQTDLEFTAWELQYAEMRRFIPAKIDAFFGKTLRQFPV